MMPVRLKPATPRSSILPLSHCALNIQHMIFWYSAISSLMIHLVIMELEKNGHVVATMDYYIAIIGK